MDALLPHYERELASLRQASRHFAERYPKLAGHLMLSGDVAEDPHVERLIESFALLAARIQQRLDDDFPLLTASLLEVLCPQALRPFPSCSVACFGSGDAVWQGAGVHLPRGTALRSQPVQGVACRFRTTQALHLWPVTLTHVSHRHGVVAPPGTALPADASSVLSLTLRLDSSTLSWAQVLSQPLRFFLDAEPARVAALREALCQHTLGIFVETDAHRPWQVSSDPDLALPRQVGLESTEALLDDDGHGNEAQRLLTEYFAFPEKFNFVDIPVPWPSPSSLSAGLIVVRLVMGRLRADSELLRWLEGVKPEHLRLGCSPVVNLFEQQADPIRLSHQAVSHPVVVDGRRASAHEVHSVDRVCRTQASAHGQALHTFQPFFSMQGGNEGPYWHTHRDPVLATISPGHELRLTLVDRDGDPTHPHVETLSVWVTASNRDLPSALPVGSPGGDLFPQGAEAVGRIHFLRKPSPCWRLPSGRGQLKRWISQLSPNHLSLSTWGIKGWQEVLRVHDLPGHAANRRQIEGLVAVSISAGQARLTHSSHSSFASWVQGLDCRLTVDEDHFRGCGVGLFAEVLSRYLGLCVHTNSFVRLIVVSLQTQEEVYRCPARSGQLSLL